MKLTAMQRTCLAYLARYSEDFHPSSHMRNRDVQHPDPILSRMEERGLVMAVAGAVFPEGRCYKITDLGKRALTEPGDR